MAGNQYFLLPQQPAPADMRPRNAFGFLTGFGEAYAAYYAEREEAEAWHIGNCTPCWTKRHIYFLYRTVDGNKEYLETATGRLRTWHTAEAVVRYLRPIQKQRERSTYETANQDGHDSRSLAPRRAQRASQS